MDYNITSNLRVFGHWIDDQQPTVAPYGSFVLGLTVPIANIANPIPGKKLRRRRHLDHQPDHDQRSQLGLHAQLDPDR